MARPLPYLELALALQEGDKANDFTRALWDNSALFDLTKQDEEGNYISPHDDDLREELSGESFEAVAQRINNIVAAYPELAKKSLAHQEAPIELNEVWQFSGKQQLQDYFKFGEGEGWNAAMASLTGTFAEKNFYEKEAFEHLVGNIQSYYDDKKKAIDNGRIDDIKEINFIQELGSYLEELPEHAEEIIPDDDKRRYIQLKEPMPYTYNEGRKYMGRGEYSYSPTVQKHEDTWIGEWLKDSNKEHHKLARKYSERNKRINAENPRYQAYQEHLDEKPVGWYETFTPNKYWWDTFFGAVPSLLSTVTSTGAGLAVGSVAGPAAGIATAAAMQGFAHGPMEASNYMDTFDYMDNKYKNEDLAREVASVGTATTLAALAATEALPTGRLAKIAMPATAYKVGKKHLNKTIRDKIIKNIELEGTVLGGMLGERGRFHLMNAASQAGLEGVQEFVQYTANAMILSGYKDTKLSEEFNWDEARESLLGGIMMGGITGGGFSMVGGRKGFTREQAKNIVRDIDASPQDVLKVAGVDEKGRKVFKGTEYKRDKKTTTITDDDIFGKGTTLIPEEEQAKPTIKGYVKEILSSGTDKIKSVPIDKVKNETDKALIRKQRKFEPGRQLEKLASTLKYGGKKLIKSLSSKDKESINDMLLGGIELINKDILGVVKDSDNVINDFVTGKLSLDYKTGKTGKITTPIENRKISVRDKKYIKSLVDQYEAEITEGVGEDASESKIANWLKDNKGINITKEAFEKEAAQQAMGKIEQPMGKPAGPMTDEESAAMFAAWSPEGSMPYGKQPTKKPKVKPKVKGKKISKKELAKLEKPDTKKAEKVAVGSKFAVLQENNPYTGKVGKLVKQTKTGVTLKFKDGSRRTFYPDQVAMMPGKEKSSKKKITDKLEGVKKEPTKPRETLYDVKVDMYENPNVQDKTGDNQDVWVVKNLKEAKQQLKSIKSGLGKGKNFANKIEKFEDHYILKHKKGDDKHIYIKGTEPEGLIPDTKGRIKGKPYIKGLKPIPKIGEKIEAPAVPKKLTKKKISKIKIDARRDMAEIESIEGVTIAKKDLPKGSGLERIGHIEMIEDLQKKGVGKNYVDNLKILRKTQNRKTIDIIAKPGSEGFWEKQGFKKVFDVNKVFDKEGNLIDENQFESIAKAQGYKSRGFVSVKESDFLEELVDDSGKAKKVDGKIPIPMVFDLKDVVLQDLVAQKELSKEEKPEYLALPKKKKETLKKLDEGTEKKKTASEEFKKGAEKLGKGLGKISSKGAFSPGGDVSEETAYNKAKEHFDESYEHFKNAYNMTIDDFVMGMFRAIKEVPRNLRRLLRRLLMRWASQKDPNFTTRANNNKIANIVELMGFGGRMRARLSRELMDSGTMDRLVNAIDENVSDNSYDSTRERMEITDTSDHEEIGNDLTFEGYDFRGDKFFKFLEDSDSKGWLNRKQVNKLMKKTLTGDKDILLKHLEKKYDFVPSTIEEENMVQAFWVRNQTINRMSGLEKPAWWWANLDENGRKVKNKFNKKLIPKIGGSARYGKDIRRNTDLPSTYNVSFVDWNLQSKVYEGHDIPISRIYLKDLVDVWVGKRDENGSQYFAKPEFTNLTRGSRSLVQIWDYRFAGEVDRDSDGKKIIRTVVELKGGGNNPSFVVARIPEEILEMSEDNVLVSEYLENEIEKGNMTKDMANDMIDSINKLDVMYESENKYVAAQHITTHELMKRAHGARYLMRTDDILHHIRRGSLPYGEGTVPIGLGNNTIKILDQSKVTVIGEFGKRVPMTEYIAGLEGRSRSDGATITDTETLDKIANAVGRSTIQNGLPMREVKTVIWYNSVNDNFAKEHYPSETFNDEEYWEGIHYLAMKHNEFVADEHLKFVDENNDLIAYTVRENNKIRIYDSEDNRINRLTTLDEAKEPDGGSGSFELKGRASTDILTLPEESTRVIKVPSNRAKNSAAFPFTWLSKLYNPKFDTVRNEIEKRLLQIAEANVNAMFDARKNPEIMASLYGQMKNDNTSFVGEVEQLVEPERGKMIGDGYNLPHIVRGILEPIKNKLIKENAYRGRRRGFGNFPVLKPDYTGEIATQYDGIAISEDDYTTVNFIKNKLNLDRGLVGEELQSAYNEASIAGAGVHLLVGRFPVYSPNGVVLLKVSNIVPSGHGNVAWLHPDMLSGPLQADQDGDAISTQIMYFGQNYSDETVINALLDAKDSFKEEEDYVRLEYFKKGDRKLKATSKQGLYDASVMQGVGLNSQGILTNAITFFEDMYYKGFKATIGGQKIVTRNPDSAALMSYAPLNKDVTQQMLDDANMGTLVTKKGKKWKEGDGKKYLLTTSAKELRILLQAAVDHAKELLLHDWGYDGYDFIIPKMFVQRNNSPIGKKQSKTIGSIIRKILSHGTTRRGRDKDSRRTKGIASMFKDSEDMFNFINMKPKKQGKQIATMANLRRKKYKKLENSTAAITKISFNGNVTPTEKLISTPYSVMDKYQKENPDDIVHEHPFGYTKHRIVNGLVKTKNELYEMQLSEERWYPEDKSWNKKRKQARRFINQLGTEFYRIHANKELFNKLNESKLTSAGYPYNDEILDLIEKWYEEGDKKKGIKAFKDLDDEQRAYATLRFLRGLRRQEKMVKNINKKQASSIVNRMMNLKEKINKTNDENKLEYFRKNYEKLREELTRITTKTAYYATPRIRDITTILPMQLMHPDVWATYAETAGPNIRNASEMPEKIDKVNKKINKFITKDCP